MNSRYDAYVDGASRGNPGEAAIGISIRYRDSEAECHTISECLGIQTNNYAEYLALIEVLKWAVGQKATSLYVFSDSQLVVRQVQGIYKVKNPEIKKLHSQVMALVSEISDFKIEHIRREFNCRADELANIALDGATA